MGDLDLPDDGCSVRCDEEFSKMIDDELVAT